MTEPSQIERGLLAGDGWLDCLMHELPAVLWTVDRDLRYTSTFGVALRTLGLEPGQTNGMSLFDFESLPVYVQAHHRALAGHSSTFSSHYGCNAFQSYVRPLVDASGAVVGVLGVALDVTAHGQTEAALRDSEAKYRQLFQAESNAILVVDAVSLQFVDVNDAAVRLYGYGHDEFLHMTAEDISQDPGGTRAYLTGPAGPPGRAPVRYHRKKDGTVFPVEIATCSTVIGGRNVRFGAVHDVTERLQAEELLRHITAGLSAEVGESFFHSLVGFLSKALGVDHAFIAELMPGPVARVRTLAVSSLGQQCPDFEYDLATTPCEDILQGDLCCIAQGVRQLYPQDDLLRTLEVEAYVGIPLRDSGGQTLGLLSLLHGRPLEATEKAGSLLRIFAARAAAELERRRTERDRQVAEEQLRQAQKMEAVGRLAGGIAHDSNNMLSVIIGYSTMLLEHPDLPASLRGMVKEIHQAADHSARLTDQLLAFSRKQRVKLEVIDLNEVLRVLETMLHPLLGEDIGIRLRLASDLARVNADLGQLQQIVWNLAVNARDAMPAGGTVLISTANVALTDADAAIKPGLYVQMVVEDEGTGIEAEVLPHIFEPFFTTKEQGQGTGLGLAIVYGIVKGSGGHIHVVSEPHKGTRVIVHVPAMPPSAVSSLPPPEAAPPAPRGTETVLLVEDENMLRTLVQQILQAKGYHVLAAADTDDAQRLFDTASPRVHLLLTDVVMPQMSGPDLAARLRAGQPGLKVLYMSGYTTHAAIHGPLCDEVAAFLPKPFSPEALAGKVREVLDRD